MRGGSTRGVCQAEERFIGRNRTVDQRRNSVRIPNKVICCITLLLCLLAFPVGAEENAHATPQEHLSKIREMAQDPTKLYDAAQYYEALNTDDQKNVFNLMNRQDKWYLTLLQAVIQKEKTITDGWNKPTMFYQNLEQAIRAETKNDGKYHYFSVSFQADHPELTKIASIPSERGELTNKAMARVKNGQLLAAFVFSDMGHGGFWGVLISDRELPVNTDGYGEGDDEYWGFSGIGKKICPHIYEAYNNMQ
jgi:hypothetical protein